ncbi:MAG: D-2-hydroxyacid dehydrogenase [Brumimicrobium sp.]|nr:D-2-hydroxyacid dehydrogenase [Brumimicrobium sp.]MCO5268338.1 D-2-hydroxyacid dehydrogenase [Brumimicrobium sp.]
MKILANDGISQDGIDKLQAAGFYISTEKVEQDKLVETINKEGYSVLLVRSATTARKELIDACPNLKFIGRGGVGMDNIDVEYARSKGIRVENTPASSSQSVAELAMASLFSLARSTFDSYKEMTVNGNTNFNALKKKYGKGVELRGKTLLIIGFGRIGRSLASYALGIGMKIIAIDQITGTAEIPIYIEGIGEVMSKIEVTNNLNEVWGKADFISIHVPKQADGKAVIGKNEFQQMKKGVRLINLARGGVIDEDDLLEAIQEGKVAAAAIDVFENEPTPKSELLTCDMIACTPHIGAATNEAQDRIGVEMADKIIEAFK